MAKETTDYFTAPRGGELPQWLVEHLGREGQEVAREFSRGCVAEGLEVTEEMEGMVGAAVSVLAFRMAELFLRHPEWAERPEVRTWLRQQSGRN